MNYVSVKRDRPSKVADCAEHISAITSPHQLCMMIPIALMQQNS